MLIEEPKRWSSGGRAGFTLIEALISLVLLTAGIVPLLYSLRWYTEMNYVGHQLTEAMSLTQEIREWTLRLPFSDPDLGDGNNPPGGDGSSPTTFVDDLDDLYVEGGLTYSPPACTPDPNNPTAVRRLDDRANWSQVLTLTWRDAANPTQTVNPGLSDLIHVQVEIFHHDKSWLTTGWLISRYETEE